MGFLATIVVALLAHLQAVGATAAIVPHGSSLTLGETSYHVPWNSVAKLPSGSQLAHNNKTCADRCGHVPVTVVDVTGPFTQADLEALVDSWTARDDVFSAHFLHAILLRSSCNASDVPLDSLATAAAQRYGTAIVEVHAASSLAVAAGPYMASTCTGGLHTPYRLYVDFMGAFHQGVLPAPNGGFTALTSSLPSSSSTTVGVPSRLYYTKSATKPLAGVRLGVKDIFNLQGLKTSAGSRAYYDVYDAANATAPSVQLLIDAGAIVVGKMQTTQFAAPENARDAIDYQAPFNPRADGYQEVGSSSSGPGAAMASYDWLDLALGSDTGGSIRVPAEFNGLFGNRPTHNLTSLDGVVPLAPQFDTPGFLVRDLSIWKTAIRVLYTALPTPSPSSSSTSSPKFPSKVLTYAIPTTAAEAQTPADLIIANFVQNLTNFLSANTSSYNYTSHWTTSHPANTPSDIQELVGTTWALLSAQEQIRLVRDPLFAKYSASHDGRRPYVNPSTNGTWTWASGFPDSIAQAEKNKTIFMDWWNTEVLPPANGTNSGSGSCSSSLFLYVFDSPAPLYRYLPGPNLGTQGLPGVLLGLNTGFISPMAGTPEIVVPLGEVEYLSDVTGKVEVLPVPIRIQAARGCDAMLVDLVADLAREGIVPMGMRTGRSFVGGGKILI